MHRSSEKSKNKKATLISRFLLFAVCLGMVACSENPTSLNQDHEGVGEVSVAIKLSKVVAASLFRAEIVITASDMADIRQDLLISGDTASGMVEDIPAGSTRLFTLNGYDSSGDLIYSGSSNADIIAGQLAVVRITMRRVNSQNSKPQLRILSPVAAERLASPCCNTTLISGEIENFGTADANNVVVELRARNSNGSAISDSRITISKISKGEKSLFTAKFSQTESYRSDTRYITSADYTITSDEGENETGTIIIN